MKKPSAKERRQRAFIAAGRDKDGTDPRWKQRVHFVRYDPNTGRVRGYGQASEASLDFQEEVDGFHFLRVEGHPDTHYVDLKTKFLMRRTACPATLEGNVFRNLPVPCQIVVRDPSGDQYTYDCDEPELKLEFEDNLIRQVTIKSVPHKDGIFEVSS